MLKPTQETGKYLPKRETAEFKVHRGGWGLLYTPPPKKKKSDNTQTHVFFKKGYNNHFIVSVSRHKTGLTYSRKKKIQSCLKNNPKRSFVSHGESTNTHQPGITLASRRPLPPLLHL